MCHRPKRALPVAKKTKQPIIPPAVSRKGCGAPIGSRGSPRTSKKRAPQEVTIFYVER